MNPQKQLHLPDTFATQAFTAALMVLALVAGSAAVAAAPDARPNIIFILADDLGYGDLGCYGGKVIQTPHLDAMASQGMRFTDFYAGAPVCAPSRSCLMTGQHTGHTYMRGNGDHWLRPDPQDITVARVLKSAGYATAMIGKASTSGSPPDDLAHPNKKGFDHFFGVLGHREAHHYFPPVVYRNGKKIELEGNKEHEGDQYAHDLYLAEAKQWIEQHKDGPFFLHYSALIPHASLYAPEQWVAKYRGKVGPERKVPQQHYRGTDEPNAVFAAMVSRLDWEVGQLLAKLDQLGIGENTVVMFASDNGAHSAGGHSEGDFNSSGPLRGEKRDMYEGGIRSPLIVRWPGKLQAGSVSGHPSAFWDFLPTAAELAGAKPPADIDGISFVPTLLGRRDQKRHDYLYWEFFEQGGKRAVRIGNYKAVQNNVNKKPDGSVEIYNLATDLGESKDIADKHPELVAKARGLFHTARTPSPIERFNFPDSRRAK